LIDTTFLAVRATIRQIVSSFSYYLARCLTLLALSDAIFKNNLETSGTL